MADATAVLNVELQKVGKNNEETGMNGDMTAVVEASQVAAAANAEVHPEIAQANQERSQRERVDAAHNVIERNRQAHMNSGAWIPGQPVMNGLLPDFSKKK